MPTSWQKSSFPATTAAIVIVSVAGLAMNALRPLVPREPQSALRVNDEEYLRAGVVQPIDWRNLSPDVFAEARRLDRPIMLVMGHSGSRFANELDTEILENREVAAWLRASFICVRLDISEFPAWRDIFFQYRRGRANTYSDLQVYFFSPTGQILNRKIWSRTDLRLMPNPTTFIEATRSAMRSNASLKADAATWYDEDQTAGLNLLTGGKSGEVDFQKLLNAMSSSESIRRLNPAQQELVPFPTWYLFFLFQIGEVDAATKLLDEYLRSPAVDWLDGGFYHLAAKNDLSEVFLEKSAIQTAEIMALFTVAYKKTGNPLYAFVAKQAFDYLAGPMSDRGIIKSYLTYQADLAKRSKRSSFPPRELRNIFGAVSEDLDWVHQNLGLSEAENPQMLIRLPDPTTFTKEHEKFIGALQKLREAKQEVPPQFAGERQLDTAGTACARLLRVARLLKDPERIAKAIEVSDRLMVFRFGSADVQHSTRAGAQMHRELKDYLAFADTQLEQYFLLGNVDALREGALVIERGFDLFRSSRDGILDNWKAEPGANWPDGLDVPGVVDSQGESTAAQAIRLALNYGVLLRYAKVTGLQPNTADALYRFASLSPKVLSAPMAELGGSTASLHVASFRVERTPVLLVKSPGAVEEASRLNGLFPTVSCIPLVGDLTQKGSAMPDGYYMFFDGQLSARLSEADVLRQLGGR